MAASATEVTVALPMRTTSLSNGDEAIIECDGDHASERRDLLIGLAWDFFEGCKKVDLDASAVCFDNLGVLVDAWSVPLSTRPTNFSCAFPCRFAHYCFSLYPSFVRVFAFHSILAFTIILVHVMGHSRTQATQLTDLEQGLMSASHLTLIYCPKMYT